MTLLELIFGAVVISMILTAISVYNYLRKERNGTDLDSNNNNDGPRGEDL